MCSEDGENRGEKAQGEGSGVLREGMEKVQNRHRKLDSYYEKYGEFLEKILILRTDGDRKKVQDLAVKVWRGFYREMDIVTEQGEDGIRAWLYAAAGYWCQKETEEICVSRERESVEKVFRDLPEEIRPESLISRLLFENDEAGLSEEERILVLCAVCGASGSDALQWAEDGSKEAMEAAVEKFRKLLLEKKTK